MRAARTHAPQSRSTRRPRLEHLEGRQLFAADLAPIESPTADVIAPSAIHNDYNGCDVNDDGRVNISDIIPLVVHLRTANSAADDQPPVAIPEKMYLDANGDGAVRIGDLIDVVSEVRRLTSLPLDEARVSAPRLSDGVLRISGTPEFEDVTIEEEGPQLVVRIADAEGRRAAFTFARALVQEMHYRSYGGDDCVRNATDIVMHDFGADCEPGLQEE